VLNPGALAFMVGAPAVVDLIVIEQDPLVPVLQLDEERVPRVVEKETRIFCLLSGS